MMGNLLDDRTQELRRDRRYNHVFFVGSLMDIGQDRNLRGDFYAREKRRVFPRLEHKGSLLGTVRPECDIVVVLRKKYCESCSPATSSKDSNAHDAST